MSSALIEVREQAVHGSYCPKLCTFACPVAAATGREDAKPWGLHTLIAALATGVRPVDEAAARALRGCSGCLACRVPCLWEFNLPREVRAGRAAAVQAGVADPAVAAAADRVARGASPYGVALPRPPQPPAAAEIVVVAGCRDDQALIDGTDRLFAAAGVAAAFVVPDGCCGTALADLGDRGAADRCHHRLVRRLPPGVRVVATDPHCLEALQAGTPDRSVTDLASELTRLVGDGRLTFRDADGPVVWHDPCVLARAHGVIDAPRALLRRTGALGPEPEHHGFRTACSGAGMALELLAADDAEAVADRRANELAEAGLPVVTGCAGAVRRLAGRGMDVRHLACYLADLLEDTR